MKDGLLCVDSFFLAIQCIDAVLLFWYPPKKGIIALLKKKKNLFLYSINLMLWPAVSNNQVNIG